MKRTIYTIAKEAGVSVATVSRAINPDTRFLVKKETLQEIQNVLRKYQFVPNVAAQTLSRAKFNAIGIVIPHHKGVFFNDYYAKLITGIADAFFDSQLSFKLLMFKYDTMRWDTYDFRAAEGVDGIIVVHWPYFFESPKAFDHLAALKIPVVVINDMKKGIKANFVYSDSFAGGRQAAHFLVAKGHRRIAVVCGPDWLEDSTRRLKGFAAGLKEAHISLRKDLLIRAGFDEELAYKNSPELLKKRKSYSCIFCLNDAMAFGVMRRAWEMGISCPEQVSVMGFDDEQRAAYTQPKLTTIQQPVYALGEKAAALMESIVKDAGEKIQYRNIRLPVKLIERESIR